MGACAHTDPSTPCRGRARPTTSAGCTARTTTRPSTRACAPSSPAAWPAASGCCASANGWSTAAGPTLRRSPASTRWRRRARWSLMTLAEAYAATGEFSAERQLAFYDAATRRAVAEGYAGLRVVAEVSALAADPVGAPSWSAGSSSPTSTWPRARDDRHVRLPRRPARDALADVADGAPAVHRPDGRAAVPRLLRRRPLVVAGSVDTFGADRLARVLATPHGARSAARPVPARVRRRGRLPGDRPLGRAGCAPAACRWRSAGASRLFRRMWRVLALDEVAAVTFTEAPVTVLEESRPRLRARGDVLPRRRRLPRLARAVRARRPRPRRVDPRGPAARPPRAAPGRAGRGRR